MNDIQATVEAEEADLISDEALEKMATMQAHDGASYSGNCPACPTVWPCKL
jgi:hypothetical protein